MQRNTGGEDDEDERQQRWCASVACVEESKKEPELEGRGEGGDRGGAWVRVGFGLGREGQLLRS